MSGRKSPYVTTSKPPAPVQVPTGPRLYATDDFLDGEDSLNLVYPASEGIAQGSDEDSTTSLYFKLDPDFADDWEDSATHKVQISVHYLDEGSGELTLEFSSNGTSENESKHLADLADTGEWLWAVKRLPDIRFGNTAYTAFNGADFRVLSDGDPVFVNALRLREVDEGWRVNWKGDEFDDDSEDEEARYYPDPDTVVGIVDGGLVFLSEEDTFTTATLEWQTENGKQSARVATYFDTGLNISYASFQAVGTSPGDVGIAEIQGINRDESKFAYMQVDSNGAASLNLANGKVQTVDTQNLTVRVASSTTNDETMGLFLIGTVGLDGTGTPANGFGVGMRFMLQNAAGSGATPGTTAYAGQIFAEWIDAGMTNANLVIKPENEIRFDAGTTPTVVGAHGGNAALIDLLTKLDTMGLIVDGSS